MIITMLSRKNILIKIEKKYNSFAYTTILEHENIINNSDKIYKI